MAGSRKPGPLGRDGQHQAIDHGTLCRQASPPPGPVCGSNGPHPRTAMPSTRRFCAKAPPPALLQFGDRGEKVKNLQSFLNLRLDPSPPLKVDGCFGYSTYNAVREFQRRRLIPVDGKVGDATWYQLISSPPANQPIPQPGRPGFPMTAPSWQPPPDSVMDWPLERKFQYVVDKLPGKLPSQVRGQFVGLVSPLSLVIMLVTITTSMVFGVGEFVMAGMLLIFGEQVIFDLAHAAQETALAVNTSELDQAAVYLAEAIATLGVAVLVGVMARFALRGGTRGVVEERSVPEKTPASRPRPRPISKPRQVVKETPPDEPPAPSKAADPEATSSKPSGGSGRKWKFGRHKDAPKWARQMKQRGWTVAQIDEAIGHGQQYPAPNNVNPANGATRFVNPTTGRYLVLDDATGEILQLGGDGFVPNQP